MTECKTYPLSLSRSYVRHWGLREAARELIQNAIDNPDSPFEYSFDDGALTITNRRAFLSPRTLLLGATSKADDPNSIGSFGEGYKLALLVLVREGYPVTIHNGPLVWRPAFEFSEAFGEDMLVIHETQAEIDAQAVTFEIGGISDEDCSAVREMCLMMQPPMRDVIGAPQGHILPSAPGKLYVGGLFVCETQMRYGYDVKPEYLSLERDRQTVDGFDLKLLTERMWLATGRWDTIIELIECEAPDVETIRYGQVPADLAERAANRFEQQHAGRYPVASQADADRFATGRTVIVPKGLAHVITHSPRFATRMAVEAKPMSPKATLERWFEDNKKYLKRLPKVSFKQLVRDADKWGFHGCPF